VAVATGNEYGLFNAAKIRSGTVGVNMPFTAFPGISFGGSEQSGFGRKLSIATLDLFNPFGL
jgi:acyl-CoA reductase-like NAD-dependent aldehyde dehydrogenase